MPTMPRRAAAATTSATQPSSTSSGTFCRAAVTGKASSSRTTPVECAVSPSQPSAAVLSQQQCRSRLISTTGISAIPASSSALVGTSGQSASWKPKPTSGSPSGGRGARTISCTASEADAADETSTRRELSAAWLACTCESHSPGMSQRPPRSVVAVPSSAFPMPTTTPRLSSTSVGSIEPDPTMRTFRRSMLTTGSAASPVRGPVARSARRSPARWRSDPGRARRDSD